MTGTAKPRAATIPTELEQSLPRCGDRPKRIAFGVAPLGIISIGVVPMGVVSIGVVGMGVLNACVVGMGVLVAGGNVMGIWQTGPEGLGRLGAPAAALHQHHSSPPGQVPTRLMAYSSREEALRQARRLGCSDVHAMESLWMPCTQHPR